MLKNKKRKEVLLDAETVALLQIQAEKEGRNLKNYMEHILRERANNFELTDEYKSMMDDLLNRHEKGDLKYIDKDEFFKRITR